jgi:hypothetical protein
MLNVHMPGYVKISIKKCDESEPTFSLTQNYNDFISEIFSYEVILNEELQFDYTIKIK